MTGRRIPLIHIEALGLLSREDAAVFSPMYRDTNERSHLEAGS